MENREAIEILKRNLACGESQCPFFVDCSECENRTENHELAEALSITISALEKPEQRWIPVTERLPEEEGCYLVTVKNDHKRRYSKTAWYSGDGWFARQDIIAWRLTPEPYTEEET